MRSDWRKGTIRSTPRRGQLLQRRAPGTEMRQTVRLLRRVMLGALALGLLIAGLGVLTGG